MSAILAALESQRDIGASRCILCDGNTELAAAETLDRVERMAAEFRRAEVQVLAIAADNSVDWVIADLAAQRAQIPVVPLPAFFSSEQIIHALNDSGVDAIIADELGSQALQSLPTQYAAELSDRLTLLRLDRQRQVPAYASGITKVSYTSGTTGAPKGVLLPQTAIDAVAQGLTQATSGVEIERHLCLLPLAVLLENLAGVYAPLVAGVTVYLPSITETGLLGASGLAIEKLIACLHRYQPHSIILLPQMLNDLVGAVEQGFSLPSSLRFAAVGGGVVGTPLLDRADRTGLPVFEGYGLTECCSVVALNTPSASRPGSVGRPLPQCRIRIADDGEVFVRGATAAGYAGSDDGVAEAEIATGDIGHIDADGFLFIHGRKKSVFITSFGRNFSPEWVEAQFVGAASIAQLALIGDGKPFNIAVIVPAADASVAAIEQAVAATNRRLPDYARVSHWILASEPFSPRQGTCTPNGRLRRQAIQQRYAAEIEACYDDSFESYA